MVEDENFKAGVKKAIASLADVDESLVSVTLSVVARRLEAASARRLASGIEAAYSIIIPVASEGSTTSADAVKASLEDITPDVAKDTIKNAIRDSVDDTVWSQYETKLNSMSVDAMVSPEITTNPDNTQSTTEAEDARGSGPGQASFARLIAAPDMKALATILVLLAPAIWS